MALDNVITLISDAIEASYYLAPSEPGLSRDEVMSVMATLGLRPGEVADALDRLISSRLTPGARGLTFRADALPVYLENFEFVFDGDPRNRQAFGFVADFLRDAAREKGLRSARLSINFIIARSASMGFPEEDIALAAFWLSWMKLATISDGTITPTDRLLKMARNGDPQQTLPVAARRADFPKLYAATREVFAQRAERKGWRELREGLHGLDVRLGLAPNEELVLDTIVSLFADSGEAVSLDDVLRLIPQQDVRQVVHSRLERSGLVRVRTDTRVLPSLPALRRTPELFSSLLLAVNEALRNARIQWEQKRTRAPLTGVHGLIPIVRPDAKQSRIVRETRLLLDSLSLTPALYPATPTDVEIRDDVRDLDTVVKLIEHQAGMRDVGAAVRANLNLEPAYATFLRAMLAEVGRSFRVSNIDFRSIGRQLHLDSATIGRFVERARAEGVLQDSHDREDVHRSGRAHGNNQADHWALIEQFARWLLQQGDGQTTTPRGSLGTVTGRRPENQDRALFARVRSANKMQLEIAVVCDGIGGMEDGALCASVAIASFVSELVAAHTSDIRVMLERSIDAANQNVFRMRAGRGGTTLSALVFFDSNVVACHVGDSRIFGLSDAGALTQLSPDDTVKGQLDAMGVERDENVPLHERLLQYVGMGEELQPHIFPMPSETKLAILTSDGAHRVRMPMLQELVRNAESPESLVTRLLSISDWIGGVDNASVIALPLRSAAEQVGMSAVLEAWAPASKAEFFSARTVSPAIASDERAPSQGSNEKRSRNKRRSIEPAAEGDDGYDEELAFTVGPASPSPTGPDTPSSAAVRGRKP